MLKRMTISLLGHRPTCGVVASSSSVLVTHSASAALLSNVVSSDLFRPVCGAQLGAGRKFHYLCGNVLKGRRVVHSQRNASSTSREGLADMMRVQEAMKAETAVDNREGIDTLLPGDAEVGEDGDAVSSKSKVRIRISKVCCILR